MLDSSGRVRVYGSKSNRQWTLHWPDQNQTRPVSAHPALKEWGELAAREAALGRGPEVPVLLDPQGFADVRLIFRRSRYAALARSTRETYDWAAQQRPLVGGLVDEVQAGYETGIRQCEAGFAHVAVPAGRPHP
ncbi:hypothetical protein [Mycobacteroides abscessus]|uniref:hypothetical protein n=1 Tax=Mycobacteroides abscessus TaxID=36809 RepID=UPI001F5FF2A1|nr:hypothetical protein [Mycobacteroides abscessus]